MTTLIVQLKNNTTQHVGEIHFDVFDTEVSKKWLEIVAAHISKNDSCRFNYNKIIDDSIIEEQFKEFKKNISFINSQYDKKLTELTTLDNLINNSSILNDLHMEFEVYGDRTEELRETKYFDGEYDASLKWPGAEFNLDLDNAFRRLNEQIHRFENVTRFWDNREAKFCSCLVDWEPPEHKYLEPEDYLLFTPEMFWGYIYLGYSTTGKHWHSASYDSDPELINRDEVRPQKHYSAEFYMNFLISGNHYTSLLHFHKWWVDNIKGKKDISSMTLPELAVGYIPLAEITGYRISGRFIRVFQHSMTYREKLMFNKDIWSNFDEIGSVRIVYE